MDDELRAARLRAKGIIEVNSPFDPSDPNSPHLGDCRCDGCLLARLDAAANGTYNYSERDQLYRLAHKRIEQLSRRVALFDAYLKQARETAVLEGLPEDVLMQLGAKVLVPEIIRLRALTVNPGDGK